MEFAVIVTVCVVSTGIMCVVMGVTMIQANTATTALNELYRATELRFGQVDQDLSAIRHELNQKSPRILTCQCHV